MPLCHAQRERPTGDYKYLEVTPMTPTATEMMQKEWERINQFAGLQNSAATALIASVEPVDFLQKSSLFSATSAVQKAIESMSLHRHVTDSIVQKVGRSFSDYDFGFKKFGLGPVAQSMGSLSLFKDSLAMRKLSNMDIWGNSEKHLEIAKSVQRMLKPLRGLETIRDSFAAQTTAKLDAISEFQKSMERYSSVNIAQKASMSLLGVSAIQDTLGFKASAVQQAMKTMKHMRLFEESDSVTNAISQMDSLGAFAKSIQALNHDDFFARAINSINTMAYQSQFEPVIPDIELMTNIQLITNSTQSEFLDVFKKLNPYIQILIVFMFLQIFMPQVNNVVSSLFTTPVVEQYLKTRKMNTDEIRTIKNTPMQGVDTSNIRFVFKNDVKLRSKPNTHSEVLDSLVIGQVITILERRKGWAEVVYPNDDGQTCRGWIMTRYTAKLKK